jgi:hypothetical protein
MNKLNLKVVLGLLGMCYLTACNQSEEVKVLGKTQKAESAKKEKENKVEKSLAEQGFIIDSIRPDVSGVIELELDGPKGRYYGLMNEDFEWLLEPTSKIKDIHYADGGEDQGRTLFGDQYIMAAIQDTREVRDTERRSTDYPLLWGFLNDKGEWQIEPQFRSVWQFSEGFAIVETIEKDRDDLKNSRIIVIDSNGNEVFELVKKYNIDDYYEQPEFLANTFNNGYLEAENGFYNTKGEFFQIDFIDWEDPYYEIIDNKIVYSSEDNNDILIKSFDGKLVSTIKGPTATEEEGYGVGLQTNKLLAKEQKFLAYYSNETVLMDITGKKYLSGEDFNLLEQTLTKFQDDYTLVHYDFNGQEVYKINSEKIKGAVLNKERYWETGNEYDRLVSVDGTMLLDEDKKIKVTSLDEDIQPVVHADIRKSKDSKDFDEYLINMNTLNMIKKSDLLKQPLKKKN